MKYRSQKTFHQVVLSSTSCFRHIHHSLGQSGRAQVVLTVICSTQYYVMFPSKAAGFTPVSPMDNQLLCERVEVVTVPAQGPRALPFLPPQYNPDWTDYYFYPGFSPLVITHFHATVPTMSILVLCFLWLLHLYSNPSSIVTLFCFYLHAQLVGSQSVTRSKGKLSDCRPLFWQEWPVRRW